MLTPTARRTYAPRGETPVQRCWSNHGRISVISAITISPRRNRLGLYFMILPDNTGAKAADMITFLRLLRHHLGSKLSICWDRGRIHDYSLAVRKWLTKQKGIRSERFPPYAPELNPDEYVWSYAKYARLCNYAAPNMTELRKRIDEELKHLAKNSDLLQSFIDHAKLRRKNNKSLCKYRNQ